MNAKSLAIASTIGAVTVMALLLAYPAMAATATPAPKSPNFQKLLQQSSAKAPENAQLAVGKTVTLTSIAGGFRQVGSKSVNGTATGSLALQVTGDFKAGYSLSVTGGTISFNGNTYTVSGGSAQAGSHGGYAVGQGQAGTSASFLFSVRDLGKFGNTNYGVLTIDLSNGSAEYGLRLLVTISS
jgi:hypothetical protein